MKCAGINPDTQLVEIVELSNKKCISALNSTEYNSTVLNPNPLFVDFIKACINK
jgi:CTP synthase